MTPKNLTFRFSRVSIFSVDIKRVRRTVNVLLRSFCTVCLSALVNDANIFLDVFLRVGRLGFCLFGLRRVFALAGLTIV